MPRPETAVRLFFGIGVAANNEPEAMWREKKQKKERKKHGFSPPAICRTLIALHSFLQAHIYNSLNTRVWFLC